MNKESIMKIFNGLSLLVFLLSTALNVQATSYSPQSMMLLNQQTEDINKTIQLIAQHEATLGNKMTDLSYTVSLPSQSISELGLVLDFESAAKGFKVLSVTPGSYADQLLIKSNDFIVKVNDKNIDTSSKNTLKQLFQRPQKITKIAFQSAGVYHETSTLIKALYLPEVNLTIGQNNFSDKSLNSLEQLKQRIQGTLLTISESEKKLGNDMHQFSYLANIPAQTLANLGLVIALDSASRGYRVLDILVGSSGEFLTIEKGDLLISINHLYILHAAHNNLMNEFKKLSAGEEVTLGFLIDSTEYFITTKIRGQHIPAINFSVGNTESYPPFIYQLQDVSLQQLQKKKVTNDENACGVVSIFKSRPTITTGTQGRGVGMSLGSTMITSIDGNDGKLIKHTYSLPIGKHTIELKSKGRGKKAIVINIQANKKYELSAFFFTKYKVSGDRLKSLGIPTQSRRHRFWLPSISSVTDRVCSL